MHHRPFLVVRSPCFIVFRSVTRSEIFPLLHRFNGSKIFKKTQKKSLPVADGFR
jgi:hypothetical protein